MNPFSINPLHALGAGVVALAIGFGGGWMVNGWRLGSQLSELRASHAEEKSKQAGEAVTTMKADAENIHKAASEFTALQNTLGPKFEALKKEVKNAKPLPAGCGPDAVRVRNLDAAIEAANAAASGQ